MSDGQVPDFPKRVVEAIRTAIGAGPFPLHAPSFGEKEWIYVRECLDSTFVSSVGKFVDQFEAGLAAYTGAKHAIAVVNGTAALHLALLLAGVRANDEVLVPALCFVATANAVSYCGATPHFVDSTGTNLGIDPGKLREHLTTSTEYSNGQCVNSSTGRVIRALVPMHTFGHPSALDELVAIASEFNLALIEDAAESLGSYYRNQHTGTFGLMGVLSFNGNKTITTGGGGAILTNDEELARKARHLSTTAKVPHAWEYQHDDIGFNYRMPNLNAALGCAQLEKLPDLLNAKRKLFTRYRQTFSGLEGVRLFAEPENCQSNYWLQTLRLEPDRVNQREDVLQFATISGYTTRPVWNLVPQMKPYAGCPAMDLVCALDLAERLINIPSSSSLIDANHE